MLLGSSEKWWRMDNYFCLVFCEEFHMDFLLKADRRTYSYICGVVDMFSECLVMLGSMNKYLLFLMWVCESRVE